jgi:hypothetical protein
MAHFGIDTLGGFLQVGPHYFPKKSRGAQIIRRGPHGKRLAQDPVKSRAGKPRGSGFRFWVEQIGIKADEKWNPRQKVVGLMGLGSLGQSGWVQRLRYGAEIQAAIRTAPRDVKLSGEIAASALGSAISQAARNNEIEANKALTRAVLEIGNINARHPNHRLALILTSELEENVNPLMAKHLARTPEQQERYMRGQRGAEEAFVRYRDPEAVQAALVAEDERRRREAGECVSWLSTPSECLEDMQSTAWKVAAFGVLGAAALIAIYGFSSGVGKGAAQSVLK